MNKISLTLLSLVSWASAAIAQKVDEVIYINPPAVRVDNGTINVADIVAKEDYCKLKLEIANTSKNHYLFYDFAQTGFNYGEYGIYYSARSKNLWVAPEGKKASVAEVKGNAKYMVSTFGLHLDGLMAGKIPDVSIPMDLFPLEVGQTNTSSQYAFDISTVKVEQSKKMDKLTAVLKIAFSGSERELGLVTLQNAVVLDKNGAKVADFNINPDKLRELTTGEDIRVTVSVPTAETSFYIAWSDAFKVVQFEPVSINPITLRSTGNIGTPVTQLNTAQPLDQQTAKTNNTSSIVTNCTPYQGNGSGKVKVNIHNTTGECFNLSANGAPLPQQTSNATMYWDYGKKSLAIQFASGVMMNEHVTIFDTWEAVTYRIKKNKKGEYVLNCDLMSVVLNEKGRAQQQSVMAGSQATAPNHSTNFNTGTTTTMNNVHSNTGVTMMDGGDVNVSTSGMRMSVTGSGVSEDISRDINTFTNTTANFVDAMTTGTDAILDGADAVEEWGDRKADEADAFADKVEQDADRAFDNNSNTTTTTNYHSSTTYSNNGHTTTSSYNSSSNSSSAANYPAATSGSTRMRFKFLNGGAPIANTFISIKSGGATIASGMTASDGTVTMSTNYPNGTYKIDLYGMKDDSNWNVSELYTLTVANSSETVTLDIAKSMEMMNDAIRDAMNSGGW